MGGDVLEVGVLEEGGVLEAETEETVDGDVGANSRSTTLRVRMKVCWLSGGERTDNSNDKSKCGDSSLRSE